MISFNLDDGWDSGYANGLPIFDTAAVKTTYYITTNHLAYPDFITPQELQSVKDRGHEIGNHTRSHADLTLLTENEARQEVAGAKQDLELLGIQTSTFAYPYGASNTGVQNVVQNAGYAGARGTDDGYIDSLTDPMNLPSWDIGGMSFEQVQAIIDGAVDQKKWVILIIHKVDVAGDPESVSSELLQQTVDYVKANNVETLTNAEGLAKMPQIQ